MDITSAATLYLQHLGKQRPIITNINANIYENGGPAPSTLTEITGVRRSGKTLLLMQLVSHCVTQCDVIFLNVSNKIDAHLLRKLIKHAVEEANPNATAAVLEDKIEKCMESLQIIDCFSSIELEMAIKALDHFMLLDNERISLIAVDSLCEFYWIDLQPGSLQRKYTYYMNWLSSLRRICNKFYVSCIYTVDNSFNRKPYASSRAIAIDYKLQLESLQKGQRKLNDCNIVINDKGVQIEHK